MQTKLTQKLPFMPRTPKTPDEYVLWLSNTQRKPLQQLRTIIKAAAPEATEWIGWWVIIYKYKGKMLLGIGAARNHCALYGSMVGLVEELGDELAKYDLSKGTIRFELDKALPTALIKKIVKLRVKQLMAKS